MLWHQWLAKNTSPHVVASVIGQNHKPLCYSSSDWLKDTSPHVTAAVTGSCWRAWECGADILYLDHWRDDPKATGLCWCWCHFCCCICCCVLHLISTWFCNKYMCICIYICKSVGVMRENTEAEKGRGGKKKGGTEGEREGWWWERGTERTGQHSTATPSGEETETDRDRDRMSKDGKIMTTSRLCPPPFCF